MYPGTFEYFDADSVDEAIDLLNDHRESDTELLAGGHSLIPTMKTGLATPDVVIDINDIDELTGVDITDGTTTIGAMTRYRQVASSSDVQENVPVVSEAASEIADLQVRNMGTIGGNIAHSDPSSDLPAAVLAADATIIAMGPDGERSIPVDDFFEGMYSTALADEEILTRIKLPNLGSDDSGVYVKKPHPGSGYATIGVAAVLSIDGSEIQSARIATNGFIDHALRLENVESELEGEMIGDDRIEDASEQAGTDIPVEHIMDDTHASRDFRRQLLQEKTKDALRAAANEIDEGARQ